MSDSYSTGMMTDADQALVFDTMQLFSQLQTWRNTFAAQWEEVASLILPTSRNTFFYGNFNWPGQKKADQQVDSTGMVALHRFAAILDSLLTPRNMVWHGLKSDNDDIMKDRRARLWYEQATRTLFKLRYAPIANFSSQNQQQYQSLGAFGTGGMFIDQAQNAAGNLVQGFRYKAIPLGELFLIENHQGLVCGFIRWFRLTAYQAAQKWGKERLPASLLPMLESQSQTPFDFLHVVQPNKDYRHAALGPVGMAFSSYYVSIQGQCIMDRGGYRTFPLAASRYDQAPQETYGRSPAMMVLPSLKTLNAEKRVFLKQGHRAGDPVLLTADDGLIDVSLKPGAMNKGGMSPDGKPLVGILPTGSIQITKEMMEEEKALVNDMFLVSLFQILAESPQMSATEVIERVNEKGILIAPVVGRQGDEYLGPMIDRELNLANEMGLLPPLPPILQEAAGDYHVNYTSPLARAARAQEAAGFMRTVETATNIAQATGDPSTLDVFDFDTALPDIAYIQSVPESWMADPKAVQAKRQARQQAAQQAQQVQAAPAAAAMMKAHAAQAKAGLPPGSMPQGPQGPPAQGQ
jgi:hypothetical protein